MTITPVRVSQIAREPRKFMLEEYLRMAEEGYPGNDKGSREWEYLRMAEEGIIRPKERVELSEGEILTMRPVGNRPIGGIIRYARVFICLAGGQFSVLIQSTVRLGEYLASGPDVALLTFRGMIIPLPTLPPRTYCWILRYPIPRWNTTGRLKPSSKFRPASRRLGG